MVLTLLRWVSVSHLGRAGLRSALSFLGIVLGVAVFGAIRIASESSQRAFEHSAQLIGGTDRLVVASSGGGVPENIYGMLKSVAGVRSVIPMITRYAPLYTAGDISLGTVKLVGTDLLAEPVSNPATQPDTKDGHGGQSAKVILQLLRPGARVLAPLSLLQAAANATSRAGHTSSDIPDENVKLEVGIGTSRVPVAIAGTLQQGHLADASGGSVLIADIANVQELFEEYGIVDQFVLVVDDGADREAVRGRLQQLLPPPIAVEDDGAEALHSQKITAAFRLNLNFLAAISLLVSVLLIYNSVSYEVLRRRREIGILQSIGADRKSLCILMIAETAVAGFLGAVCGTCGAYALSSGAVHAVTRSISTLYVPISVRETTLPPSLAVECIVVGVFVSMLGALLPSLEIFSITPRERLGYQTLEQHFSRRVAMLSVAGLAVLGAALLCTTDSVLGLGIYAGFLTPTFFLIGTGLLVPLLLIAVLAISRAAASRMLSVSLLLAVDHIRMTLRRNAVATAAVIVALGLYAGVTTMITSFRSSVEGWILHVTKADLFVSPGYSGIGSRGGMPLPDELVSYACGHPLVAACDWVVSARLRIDERDVRVTGTRLEILRDYDRLLFIYPMQGADLEQLLSNDDAALVSESYARKSGVKPGDRIALPTPSGMHEVTVANLFYDYSSDQGIIMIADRTFERLFGRQKKNGVSLYLKPRVAQSAAPEQQRRVESDIAERFPQTVLTVRSNSALRSEVLRVFDETFAITYALQGIALLIAFLVLAHAITMLILERKRELGVMRAIGASRRALMNMVASESLLLGVTAVIGAAVVGGGLSVILVEVVNRFFFGWSVSFSFAYADYVRLIVAVLVVAFCTGAVPGWLATRDEEAGTVRYE